MGADDTRDRAVIDRAVQEDSDAAMRHLLVFALDGQRYALDIGRVKRCVRALAITPLPEAPAIVLGVIDLGGDIIPVIDLRRRFDRPARGVRLSDHIIVAVAGKRNVAILVDETKGVIEASRRSYVPAGEILPGMSLIDGAVKLEDGMILIHDLERLLSLEDGAKIDAALEARSRGGARRS